MRRRLVLVGPVFAGTLLLAGCEAGDDTANETVGEEIAEFVSGDEVDRGSEPAEGAVDSEGNPCDGVLGDC